MRISIHKDGPGWDLYPAVEFHFLSAGTDWADTVGPVFRGTLKEFCPVNNRPHFTNRGRMRDSITDTRETSETSVVMEFAAHTPYAGYVVHGTTPHRIEPVAALALHWWDRPVSGHEYLSFRGVNHPGQSPNRFPDRALEADRQFIVQSFAFILSEHLRRALEE